MNAKTILLLLGISALMPGCSPNTSQNKETNEKQETAIDSLSVETELIPDIYDIMLPIGVDVINTLDPLNFEQLFSFSNPSKGILFSPYLYINKETAVILTKEKVEEHIAANKIINWGDFDGSGEPIEMNVQNYFNRFVYDKPYKDAPLYDVNTRLGIGNSLDNTLEVFPNTTFIEFHFEGFDPELNGMDWRTIRLVFEKENNTYYLIAIIHDEWTI
jgi:hypothetical protein